MTMIWGVLSGGKPEDDEKRRRARILIKDLDSQNPKPKIIVSSIVVAELMTGMTEDEKARFLSELTRGFEIAPLDVKAAALSAQLYDMHRDLKTSEPNDRKLFRADTLIIASSRAAGASVFYSDEQRARRMASSVMEARGLPSHSEDLFIDHEASQELTNS